MSKNLIQTEAQNTEPNHINPILEPIEIPVDDGESYIRITELPADWQKVIMSVKFCKIIKFGSIIIIERFSLVAFICLFKNHLYSQIFTNRLSFSISIPISRIYCNSSDN